MGGFGQIRDSFTPRTSAQKSLVALWKEYHLNDMCAGTKKQHDELIGLSVPSPLVDRGYEYGSAWLIKVLPNGFEEKLEELCDTNLSNSLNNTCS